MYVKAPHADISIKTLILFLLIFSNAAFAQLGSNPSNFDESVVGEYVAGSWSSYEKYRISADGTFSYRYFTDYCGQITDGKTGTVTIENGGLLRFRVLRAIKFENCKDAEIENPDARVGNEITLRLVKWGPRAYLVSDDGMVGFAAAVNFGVEPRKSRSSVEFLFERIFLRSGDESKSVDGLPQLPKEYEDLLRTSPIKAKIKSVARNGKNTIFEVDKGLNNGLVRNMAFRSGPPKSFDNSFLYVAAVDTNSATLKCYNSCSEEKYEVGAVVSTNPKLLTSIK